MSDERKKLLDEVVKQIQDGKPYMKSMIVVDSIAPEVSLLSIFDEGISMENYCSHDYDLWEEKIAIPKLKELGYKIVRPFKTHDGDSFGPLSRGILIEKDGVSQEAWYG